MKPLQLAGVLGPALLLAAAAPPERPRVLGISHVALRVSDLDRSRAFFEEWLGYSAVAAAPERGGTPRVVIIVSSRQYLELRSGLAPGQDRLDHIALETDDVAAMRRSLGSRRLSLSEQPSRDAGGNPALMTSDPEGRALELVQHAPDGWPTTWKPRSLGGNAISPRILHAGVLVGDLAAAQRFYAELLGLAEIWRGSRSGSELSWTNMRVPDGEDYVEFMLYGTLPAPDARGTQHHICLEVADIEAAKARLLERPYAKSYARPLEIRVGTNRKRQLNLYDPDGTRVELMEPFTVDGQPVPSSTAPPPQRR